MKKKKVHPKLEKKLKPVRVSPREKILRYLKEEVVVRSEGKKVKLLC